MGKGKGKGNDGVLDSVGIIDDGSAKGGDNGCLPQQEHLQWQ